MSFHILSLILAGILSIADYLTETLFSLKMRNSKKLISFSSGVVISYIVLNLLPEITSSVLIDGRNLFLYALLGFASLNLIEQFIYKEVAKNKHLSGYHRKIHVTYFFIYNFAVGLVLVNFAARGFMQTMLFFIPFLLYIIAEMLPQQFEFKNELFKALYFMAPVLGALVGVYSIETVSSVFGELISFLTGTLLYIAIRESLPSEQAERPFYFIAGILFYTAVIYLSWGI